MSRLSKILLLILVSFGLKAQTQHPSYLPNPNAPSGYYKIGYMHTTGGLLFSERDTFCAKYPTLIKHTDHNFYYTNGNCTAWFPFGGGGNITNFTFITNNLVEICTGANSCDTFVTNLTNFIGGGNLTLELAPIGSTPNANAATLVGDTILNLEPASLNFGGVVTASDIPQFFKGQKSIVANTDTLLSLYHGNVLRHGSYGNGTNYWFLNDNTQEAGRIEYTTPVGTPGIVFKNTSGIGRSQIRQFSDTGGISIGSQTGASAAAGNSFVVLNNGHTFISGLPGTSNTAITDNGYTFNVGGTSYLSGVITANDLSGIGTRMVVAGATGILSTQAIPSGGAAQTTDKQSFTATAAQTAFTITALPSDEDDFDIFINGSYVNPSFYSVSGTTLTFSAGLVLNDNMEYVRKK